MSLLILPEIGSSGKYAFKEPYSLIGNGQTEYICQSVRSLSELIANTENPYGKYYAPYKITIEDYNKDIANGASIVGLQSSSGNWLYVPNSYITSYPDVSGVRYTVVVLGVRLGAISEQFPLTSISNEIEDLVLSRTGVKPVIKPVAVSQPSLVNYSDHDRIEKARRNKITNLSPANIEVVQLRQQNAELLNQVKKLAALVKKYNLVV